MKSESKAEEIEVGKHLFAGLIRGCSQELGIGEPVINWAIEYDRSVTRYVAFLFFRSRNERFQLDAIELASLPTNPDLKQSITEKVRQALEKSLETTL